MYWKRALASRDSEEHHGRPQKFFQGEENFMLKKFLLCFYKTKLLSVKKLNVFNVLNFSGYLQVIRQR